ncbi:uncharacterized protein LOC100303947 precursor [Zea mays]|jgi:hypothetical protein|nr:uncharacterized protein LOC100303947 precursor [Zea mays]ACG31124.1 hypothetical protein [Zea mays]ACG31418.1 hypothetical protein [Zea mays]
MAQCKTIVAAVLVVALVVSTIPASADTNLEPAGGSTEGSARTSGMQKEETRGNKKPATLAGSLGSGKNAIYG